MPDLGLLRGLITVLTLSTFIGICCWAYRPANRVRFEEDGWLAFDDEEPARENERRRASEPQPMTALSGDDSDCTTHHSGEESQA
jgi:cytochrome c oxidase cbb3-type subunit 4